jgi:hypothetical protein
MLMDPCIIVQFTKKNPTRCNNVPKFYYSNLCEAQHVSSDSGRRSQVVGEHCQHNVPNNVHQLHVQQPSMYEIPEAAGAVLGS